MITANKDQVLGMFLALLPRGRAWQNHDAGGVAIANSTMKRFWRGIATVWTDAEAAVGKAFDELFCHGAKDDLDLWLEEYGLPDPTDPAGDDLCAKVQAVGGESPAYWTALASSIGITTSFRYLKGSDSTYPGVVATMVARIDTAAFLTEARRPARVGLAVCGVNRLGDPNYSRLAAMMDRSLPAHLDYIVEVI